MDSYTNTVQHNQVAVLEWNHKMTIWVFKIQQNLKQQSTTYTRQESTDSA